VRDVLALHDALPIWSGGWTPRTASSPRATRSSSVSPRSSRSPARTRSPSGGKRSLVVAIVGVWQRARGAPKPFPRPVACAGALRRPRPAAAPGARTRLGGRAGTWRLRGLDARPHARRGGFRPSLPAAPAGRRRGTVLRRRHRAAEIGRAHVL